MENYLTLRNLTKMLEGIGWKVENMGPNRWYPVRTGGVADVCFNFDESGARIEMNCCSNILGNTAIHFATAYVPLSDLSGEVVEGNLELSFKDNSKNLFMIFRGVKDGDS